MARINAKPCPNCGSPVFRKRVGGAIKRFCCTTCRWSWHRSERRRKLMKAVEAAACPACCDAVLEATGFQRLENKDGWKGP